MNTSTGKFCAGLFTEVYGWERVSKNRPFQNACLFVPVLSIVAAVGMISAIYKNNWMLDEGFEGYCRLCVHLWNAVGLILGLGFLLFLVTNLVVLVWGNFSNYTVDLEEIPVKKTKRLRILS